MKYYLIAFTIFFFSSVNAQQNCDEIRAKLEKIEKQIDKGTPSTYYDFAIALISLGNSECVSSEITSKFKFYLSKGAENGHLQSAILLGYCYHKGAYSTPINYDYSLNSYVQAIKIADEMSDDEIAENNAWAGAALLCELIMKKNPELMRDEILLGAYNKYLKQYNGEIGDFYSMFAVSNVLEIYHMVKAKALHHVYFGETKDIGKAVIHYLEADNIESYENLLSLVDPSTTPNSTFGNKAVALYYSAYMLNNQEALADYEETDMPDRVAPKLNELYSEINSLEAFEKEFDKASAPLKEIIFDYEVDYAKELWEEIVECEYIESSGYPGWKYMPQAKKNVMWEEAKKEDKSEYDEQKRFLVCKSMYDEGDYRSAPWLANAYYNGWGVKENNTKARIIFKKAYEKIDHSWSAYKYADMCDWGEGGPRNWEEAAKYYQAVQSTNKTAMRELGEFYLFGVGGLSKDKAKAKSLFQKAADKGDNTAKEYLQILKDLESRKKISFTYDDIVINVKMTESDYSIYKSAAGRSWMYPFEYNVPASAGNLTLFPQTKDANGEWITAAVGYAQYSPCGPLSGEGEHKVSITNTGPYRGLGYMVVDVKLEGRLIGQVKVPMAVVWTPEN